MSHRRRTPISLLFVLIGGMLCADRAWSQQTPLGLGQGNGPRPAGPPRFEEIAPPQKPEWYPLPADHQKYVDEILKYWEQHSSKIKTYECKFQRWEYDPVFGPKAPDKFFSYSTGEIKYAKPDKGMFKVKETWEYLRPKDAATAAKPDYQKKQVEFDDYWVCDGAAVFQFKAEQKKVEKTVLPAQMRGQAIVDGPLPFMFGAEAEKIKNRYWVRVITPEDKLKTEYHLEAVPRHRGDASSFKKVHIILDGKDYLPKMLTIFALSFNPDADDPNYARTTLEFKDRKVNATDFTKWITGDFFKVTVPSGWEEVVKHMDAGPEAVSGGSNSEGNGSSKGNPPPGGIKGKKSVDPRQLSPAPRTEQAKRPNTSTPTRR